MNQEDIQIKYLHLLHRVEVMRDRQKMYFQGRAQADLQASKRLEREVDDFIKREKKEITSGQQKMF